MKPRSYKKNKSLKKPTVRTLKHNKKTNKSRKYKNKTMRGGVSFNSVVEVDNSAPYSLNTYSNGDPLGDTIDSRQLPMTGGKKHVSRKNRTKRSYRKIHK